MTANGAVVLVAHGTRDEAGRAVTRAIADQVATRLPGHDIRLAFVDIQDPYVGDVTRDLADAGPVRVLPLLLTVGYHVRVDIARAVQAATTTVALPPLGPHPLLTGLLARRLIEVGATAEDTIVLAAAGSSVADAARDTEAVAQDLGTRLDGSGRAFGRPLIGYGASAKPTVPQAVSQARQTGRRVLIASYLLAPGHFHNQLRAAGADLVTAPLGADPAVVDVVLERLSVPADRKSAGDL